MALYQYIKYYPKTPIRRHIIYAYILMSMGCFVLLWVTWPIASFYLITEQLFIKTISPISERSIVLASSIRAVSDRSDPARVNHVDYTDANVWFPIHPQE